MKVCLSYNLFQTPPPLKFKPKNKSTIFKNTLSILYTITKNDIKKSLDLGSEHPSPFRQKTYFDFVMDDLPYDFLIIKC